MNAFLVLSLLLLAVAPPAAEALSVTFCMPSCASPKLVNGVPQTVRRPAATAGAPEGTTRNIGTAANPIWSTTIATNVASAATLGGFSVAGTAVALQSGTLQKITFNPMTITAPAACPTLADCRLELVATSAPKDFPVSKTAGGYPAGVFMSGFFFGPQSATGGDTLSMTARASGLSVSGSGAVTVHNTDVINSVNGGGAGDSAKSLPWSCNAQSTCKFTAFPANASFDTQGTITAQQKCATGQTSCPTRLSVTLNLQFRTGGNSVTLPMGTITADPPPPGAPPRNQAEILLADIGPTFENLDVRHFFVHRDTFTLTADLTLDELSNGIDPAREEVRLAVGGFAVTIPPGRFKSTLKGRLFAFSGRLSAGGVPVHITAGFHRDSRNPRLWQFAAHVRGVDLDLEPSASAEVKLSIGSGIGGDGGSALAEPRFLWAHGSGD
jgi:hypothetical protein